MTSTKILGRLTPHQRKALTVNLNRSSYDPRLQLRARIFLAGILTLLLLGMVLLSSCSPDTTFDFASCEMLSTSEDIDAWLEGQDGEFDYRPLTWTATDWGTPRTTRVIGYALSEDSNIWNHAECMILDLR